MNQFFIRLNHAEIHVIAVQFQGGLLAFVLGNFGNELITQGFGTPEVYADSDGVAVFAHNFSPCRWCAVGWVACVDVLLIYC
jgi:hypothetical protein